MHTKKYFYSFLKVIVLQSTLLSISDYLSTGEDRIRLISLLRDQEKEIIV